MAPVRAWPRGPGSGAPGSCGPGSFPQPLTPQGRGDPLTPGPPREEASAPSDPARGVASCPSRGPHRGEAGRAPRGVAASLTIMFSRACLASQQFRNTGMNRFRSGAQNICGGHGSGAGAGAAALASGGRQRTHRDDEGESVDHLQDEGHLEDLLPDVALEATGSGDGEGDRPAQARGQAKDWAQAGRAGALTL